MRSRAGGQPQRVLLKIRKVNVHGEANLAQIALARGGFPGVLGTRQRRQKHGCQKLDNGDDNQQLNESKRRATRLDWICGHQKLSLSLRIAFVKYKFQAPERNLLFTAPPFLDATRSTPVLRGGRQVPAGPASMPPRAMTAQFSTSNGRIARKFSRGRRTILLLRISRGDVTVPSLADWEKDWEKNSQRNAPPKLLPVDFLSTPSANSQRN